MFLLFVTTLTKADSAQFTAMRVAPDTTIN